MCVQIDKTRRHHFARRIDRARRGVRGQIADTRNAPVAYTKVRLYRVRAAAVDNRAATDDQIVFHDSSFNI